MKKQQNILLEKFYNNECSDQELIKVYELLNSPEHKEEVSSYFENEWREFDASHFVDPKGFERIYRKVRKRNIKKTVVKKTIYLKIAASILITVFFGTMYFLFVSSGPQNNLTYTKAQTDRGERATIILSDGSIVILAADSELRYPKKFSDNNRKIYLKGEAFFKLAGSEKPMVILANEISATVKATSFNVSAFPENKEVIVAVDQGEAFIQDRSRKPTPWNDKFPAIKLTPAKKISIPLVKLQPAVKIEDKQYLAYNKEDKRVSVANVVNEKEVFGWKDGIIYFNNADSTEMIRKLERWYDGDVNVAGCFNQKSLYSGEFQNQSLDVVLSSIAGSLHINYKIENDQVLLAGSCN